MTVGVRTVDDSSALLDIVGKYEEQNSPSVPHFLSIITVSTSDLSCMFSENPASQVEY